jgi:hypothetical protein
MCGFRNVYHNHPQISCPIANVRKYMVAKICPEKLHVNTKYVQYCIL